MRLSPREIDLERRSIASGGALTPGDIAANDVEFRCEPALYDPYPATVVCGWCGGERRTVHDDPCSECEGTGEIATP